MATAVTDKDKSQPTTGIHPKQDKDEEDIEMVNVAIVGASIVDYVPVPFWIHFMTKSGYLQISLYYR